MKHQIVIVGGGAAGISTAAMLKKRDKSLDIAIIDPSESHYYQPAFTLVGGGCYNLSATERREADCIPDGVKWLKEYAESFNPDSNSVTLKNGDVVEYDYLVVCPGLQLDWGKVKGLEETIGKNGVCSNYLPQYAAYTWECVQSFKGGKALFTQPPMPIKCAGAPQKIMYLAADHFKKKKITAELDFNTATPGIFGVPLFAKALSVIAGNYGAQLNFKTNLVAIDGGKKEAIFEVEDADGKKTQVTKSFDMIHVTPPQSAPDFIKNSPLAADSGWVDVDQSSLQHTRFENIFGMGDVTTTPNAKTAAAVKLQVPVVVKNLLAKMKGGVGDASYDGYGACPLTTANGKVLLAEFSYGGKVTPSIPLDPSKERWIYWLLKKYFFPFLYWKIMLKGYPFPASHKPLEEKK